jgi:hypothetical protein
MHPERIAKHPKKDREASASKTGFEQRPSKEYHLLMGTGAFFFWF